MNDQLKRASLARCFERSDTVGKYGNLKDLKVASLRTFLSLGFTSPQKENGHELAIQNFED
jgi:hypothetical protein